VPLLVSWTVALRPNLAVRPRRGGRWGRRFILPIVRRSGTAAGCFHRWAVEPLANLWMLMGGVVVEDLCVWARSDRGWRGRNQLNLLETWSGLTLLKFQRLT
jgi:hypothetical protein